MTRTMYDSTDPDDIPRDAEMVAYYVDGLYCWSQEWIDQFPNAVKVTISAIGKKTAQVGDVEKGCIWPPANAVDWVLRARVDGYDPTIYVNERNDWAPTRAAFDARGVAHPHWWVANYDGKQTVPSGAVAKQYAHPPMIGKHYDLSVVADNWPGVDIQEDSLMASFTDEQRDVVVAAARKIVAEYNPTADNRPLPIGTADDITGHVLSIRGLQEKMRNAEAIDRVAIANIETLCNQLVSLLGQLQVSGMTQEGFDALFRTSPLTPGLLREGSVFVDNDPPKPPQGG